MSLSCDEDYITGTGEGGCRADCLAAVDYAECLFLSLYFKPGFHVVKYLLRVFIAWIVGCEYEAVAA